MAATSSKLECICNKCGHSGLLAFTQIESHVDEDVSLQNLNQYLHKIKCQKCRSDDISIYLTSGILLYNKQNYKTCIKCSCPILAPRIEMFPDTNICPFCTEHNLVEPESIIYPKLSAAESNCPKCNNKLTIQQNIKDLSYFVGCTNFPNCWYKRPIKNKT